MGEEAYRAHERWQMEIDDYRNRLMEITQASPRYAGGEIRHETHELIIFGVGEPTKALAAEMKRAPANVRVSWQKAPYSLAELSAEAHRIITEQPCGRIYSIGPRHDGTGLHLTIGDQALLEAHDPREALSTRYPVAVEYGEPARYAIDREPAALDEDGPDRQTAHRQGRALSRPVRFGWVTALV